jgi:hypothetical protein
MNIAPLLGSNQGQLQLIFQYLTTCQLNEPPTLDLYNLKNDPTEKNNIASDHPEILE